MHVSKMKWQIRNVYLEWCRFCIRCRNDSNYTFSESTRSHEQNSFLCHVVGVNLVIRGRLKVRNYISIFQHILDFSILFQFVIFRPYMYVISSSV
ncbi:hypothetical protein MtrunA17_Chr1g0199581 [Medicago truncatula]|uniref:Transmembrane protein n=1 Tax=Medicago truncatula TaxID=3880 RepID=A0A396JT38_MEDTR|nr:hypothetical protein MtrunA17_Chr1g0199581 [Medicago truncatula]